MATYCERRMRPSTPDVGGTVNCERTRRMQLAAHRRREACPLMAARRREVCRPMSGARPPRSYLAPTRPTDSTARTRKEVARIITDMLLAFCFASVICYTSAVLCLFLNIGMRVLRRRITQLMSQLRTLTHLNHASFFLCFQEVSFFRCSSITDIYMGIYECMSNTRNQDHQKHRSAHEHQTNCKISISIVFSWHCSGIIYLYLIEISIHRYFNVIFLLFIRSQYSTIEIELKSIKKWLDIFFIKMTFVHRIKER